MEKFQFSTSYGRYQAYMSNETLVIERWIGSTSFPMGEGAFFTDRFPAEEAVNIAKAHFRL